MSEINRKLKIKNKAKEQNRRPFKNKITLVILAQNSNSQLSHNKRFTIHTSSFIKFVPKKSFARVLINEISFTDETSESLSKNSASKV